MATTNDKPLATIRSESMVCWHAVRDAVRDYATGDASVRWLAWYDAEHLEASAGAIRCRLSEQGEIGPEPRGVPDADSDAEKVLVVARRVAQWYSPAELAGLFDSLCESFQEMADHNRDIVSNNGVPS